MKLMVLLNQVATDQVIMFAWRQWTRAITAVSNLHRPGFNLIRNDKALNLSYVQLSTSYSGSW